MNVAVPPSPDAFLLRALNAADADAAVAVIRTAFSAQRIATNPPSSALRETAETIAFKIATGGGFVAFASGAPVALALWRIDGEAMQVARVATLPAWRGRGLARALIARCVDETRALGLARLRLSARLELPENERLFASLGFARVRVEAHAGFDRPTTAVMEKVL